MNNRKFVNLLAYIAVILITVATVVAFLSGRVFHWDSLVANICGKISYYLAAIVTLICAFYYASSKRNTTYTIVLVIVVIVLIVFTFII